MKEIDEKLFEELSKDDLDEEINESSKDEKKELRYLYKKEKVCPLDKEERYKLQSLIQKHGKPEDSLEEERLEEGTSNFPTRSKFPLLVFYTYDEFLYNMTHDPDYPQEEQFENERENGDFYVDWDAFEEAKDEFEQKYWDENNICVLTEDDQENLESKLDDFNDETNNIANNLYDADNDDDYYALKDIELKIEPGYYEAAYIDVDGEEQFEYMSEDVAKAQLERFNNFFKELKKEFGLTQLSLAYRASNGETGFNIVKDESLEESKKPLDKDAKELKSLYNKYVKEWKEDHKGPEYKGMEPACFDEWYDNEYLDSFDESLEESKLVEKPIGLDSGEFVPEDEIGVVKQKDSGEFTGVRRTPGKPVEYVAGAKDVDKDSKAIGALSKLNPEQRKKAWNSLMKQESLKEGVEFIDSIELGTRTIGDGPYHDGDGVIYLLKDGDKYYAEYAVENENGPIEDPEYLEDVGEHNSLEELKSALKEHNYFKEELEENKSLDEDDTLDEKKKKKEPFVKVGTGLDVAKDCEMTNHMLGSDCCEDLDSLSGILDELKDAITNKDSKKEKQLRSALRRLGMDDTTQNILLSEDFDEFDTDSYYDDEDICIYQFPRSLGKRDFAKAEEFGLEVLGKVNDLGFQPGDPLIRGKYKDLKRYCDEYLDYVMHPYYLYKEGDIDLEDILEPIEASWKKAEALGEEKLEEKKFDGKCPYCGSENIDFVDSDEDSEKHVCHDCGQDFLVHDDEEVTTRNNRPIESLEESNKKFALIVNGEWYSTYDSYEKADEAREKFLDSCSNEDDAREYYGECPNVDIREINDEELKESMKSEVTNWWKDVEDANREMKWEINIDNGDYDDVEAMHAAMFDMLDELDNRGAGELFKRGKKIYNKYAKYSKYNESLKESRKPKIVSGSFEFDGIEYTFDYDTRNEEIIGIFYANDEDDEKYDDISTEAQDYLEANLEELLQDAEVIESLDEETKENNWKVHKVTKFKIQDKDLNIDEINGESFDEVVADNLSDKEAHDLVLKLRDEESDDRFTYIQSTENSLKESNEVARVEYCVMDNLNNNIECFDNTDDAIAFAKDNEGVRVLEVKYGPKNEHGDEPELSAEEVWSIREALAKGELVEEKVEESYADARYKIEYWVDEEARDHGLGDYALERFDDLEDAKEYADKLFGDVASVEVLDTQDDDNVVYGRYPEDESVNEGGPGSGDHRTAAQRYNDRLHATFRRFDEMNNKMAQFLLDHDVSPEEVEELKKNTGLHGNALHQKLIELGLDDEFFERKRECKESINAWSIKPNETNEEIEVLVKKNDTWESIASIENCPTKDMLKEDIVKEYSKVARQVIKESGYRLVESNDDVYSLHVKVVDANTGKINKVERLMTGSKKECDARKKQLEETSPEDSYHNKNVYKVSKVK